MAIQKPATKKEMRRIEQAIAELDEKLYEIQNPYTFQFIKYKPTTTGAIGEIISRVNSRNK